MIGKNIEVAVENEQKSCEYWCLRFLHNAFWIDSARNRTMHSLSIRYQEFESNEACERANRDADELDLGISSRNRKRFSRYHATLNIEKQLARSS